jgi:hypothetical protein
MTSKGDVLEVPAFTGTVKDTWAHDGCTKVQDNDGFMHYIFEGTDAFRVKVKPQDPANWPPKPGELWKVGDTEYYVIRVNQHYAEGYDVVQQLNRPQDYSTKYYSNRSTALCGSKTFNDFKALKPQRVRTASGVYPPPRKPDSYSYTFTL